MKRMLLIVAAALAAAGGASPAFPPANSSAKDLVAAEPSAPDLTRASDAATAAAELPDAGAPAGRLGHENLRLGLTAAPYGFLQRSSRAACLNWQRRYNYASARGLQAARYGSVQEIYYWNGQIQRLNAEYARRRYCDTPGTSAGGARRGGTRGGGVCDRAAYESCMRDARSMTSPTTGGMTSTGIMMQSQCRQFISGCR